MDHISQALIEKMPKTDLHCHFDGSIRLNTLIELAKKNGIKLFSYEPNILMEHMKYGRVCHTLEEYLKGFEPLVAVLQNDDDIERAFFEVCEDASLENVWHLELRYCPYLHTKNKMTSKEVIEACLRASKKAEKELGISVRHILCGLKNDSHKSIYDIALLACEYRDFGVVAFDLAGPEIGFPIKEHQKALSLAKRNHLFITVHAGENSGPENIYEAIHDAHADRIGHGTSLLKDNELINYVVNHRIGIESCPISNLHTGSVKSLKEHPFRKFLQHKVRVSINTDNRLCSNTTITKEILAVVRELDIGIKEIEQLLINGFKSAFLPYETKALMLKDFNEEWEKLIS